MVKIARITMLGCEALQRVRPWAYIGYKLLAGGHIEHLLLKRGRGLRPVKLRMSCDDCVFGKLLKSSAVVSAPLVLEDGRRLRFLAVYNAETRRLLSKYRDRLVSVELLDVRSVVLTHRQRQVLRLAVDGAGLSPTRIAARLGVSRQAVQKMIQAIVRKMSVIAS